MLAFHHDVLPSGNALLLEYSILSLPSVSPNTAKGPESQILNILVCEKNVRLASFVIFILQALCD